MEQKFKFKNPERHGKKFEIGIISQLDRDFQVHFLKLKGLTPSHYLLDVGCGTLRGGIPLIDFLDAGHYYGIEMREVAYANAMIELEAYPDLKDKIPTIMLKNFLDFNEPQKFDYIWAFQVLYHVPDKDMLPWLTNIANHLADTGTFFGNIHQETHSRWGRDVNRETYPTVYRSLQFYKELAEKAGLSISDLGPCKAYGHVGDGSDSDEQIMLAFTKIQR